MNDGANESTATPPPGSSRERQPAVTGDQAVPEPEPACGADLDRDEVAALRAILEGTARSTGAVFFQTLVRHLASALGVSFAFVAEFAGAPTRVRTLAYWGRGRIQENLEFELAGTPCEDVVRGGLCHHPQEVRERFPGDRLLVDLGIESYLGVPLLDGEGRVLGHLAVFDERPMAAELRRLFIFRIFAARAAVELERLRVEQQLRERERQLDSLMGHLPGMAYRALADEHWTALFASKGIEDLTGYPADEFTSRRLNYADIMLPEDRPATREAVFTALRERRMYEAEHRIRHKDGSVRWIWARGHGVFAPDGSLRFIEGLNQDITRQQQAEERLRESEQRWRSLTEALPQLVWSATPDGACDYFSTQWTQHTGVPESDLLGWRWLATLHPDDREPTRRLWTDSVAGRGPYDVEYRVRRSDGVYRWFKTRGTPIRDSEGQHRQMVRDLHRHHRPPADRGGAAGERGAVPRDVRERGGRHRPQGRHGPLPARQREVLRHRRLLPRGTAAKDHPGHNAPRRPGRQHRRVHGAVAGRIAHLRAGEALRPQGRLARLGGAVRLAPAGRGR